MAEELKARLKDQAKKSGLSFRAYCNAILSEAADKDVIVQFSLVERSAANFSEREGTPDIDE